MAAAALPTHDVSPALGLWQREVESVVSGPSELPAVRAALRSVLLALAVDPASDRETRRDVRRMLEVVDPASVPPLQAAPAE
jgi:hypothetical protein